MERMHRCINKYIYIYEKLCLKGPNGIKWHAYWKMWPAAMGVATSTFCHVYIDIHILILFIYVIVYIYIYT